MRKAPSMRSIAFIAVASALAAWGWGAGGHRLINNQSIIHLPLDLKGLAEQQAFLTAHASDADGRGGIEPKHFMDMESYNLHNEFATHSISHNRDSLIALYGEYNVRISYGMLPWVIDSVTNALSAQMASGSWTNVWQTAADLGHYVADAHQPLHASTYYNGYTVKYGSGSSGIHSRYETGMVNADTALIRQSIQKSPVVYIASPLDEAFRILYASNALVDSVYRADSAARAQYATGTAGYNNIMWAWTGEMTKARFQAATERVASYYYTAWVNAGSPAVPRTTGVVERPAAVGTFSLLPNYPNPFNPATRISFVLSRRERVRLTIHDMTGREIAVLMDDVCAPGVTTVVWHASDASAGVYMCRLQLDSGTDTRKLMLLK